ncbi:MAG TPA: dihydropteroate synthase [Flavisolibacter sp.]
MMSINCTGRLVTFEVPRVMGILNATPDSFFSGSRLGDDRDLLGKAEKMLRDGATFLDIGGQSTRPGSEMIDAEEEARRVLPAVEMIAKHFPQALVSIDTFYATVARQAVDAGACMINDVSAGTIDPLMIQTVAALSVPYVLMHMQGLPRNMQQEPAYNDVVLEVYDALNKKLYELRELGVKDVIIDPGFGFGKTAAHNFQLLGGLEYLGTLGQAILIGLSRKGTITKILNCKADEALNGTTVLNTVALLNGASILRVHDVKEAMEAVALVQAFKNAEQQSK